MKVLLAGGAGYIGSHTAVSLLKRGHEVVVLDDFSNSHIQAVRRVESMTGIKVPFIAVDLSNRVQTLSRIDFHVDAVIHFAGLKSVNESIAHPNHYYQTNINTTLTVLEVMREQDIRNLVFSSSATVYGTPVSSPIGEDHPTGSGLTSPYAWSKFMSEQIIRDEQRARPELAATLLRYFNPIGVHPSGELGEDSVKIPTNLMPLMAQVAIGELDSLQVFGDKYLTSDGTGVRDYIDVMDLAEGHVVALERSRSGVNSYNLGSGTGVSVLELIAKFESQSAQEIKYVVTGPREGDLGEVVADPSKAAQELDWRATRTLEESCKNYWNWRVRKSNEYTHGSWSS